MDTKHYGTTRIWKSTLQVLRFIHAMTGESIVVVLDRLARQELVRLQKEGDKIESWKTLEASHVD